MGVRMTKDPREPWKRKRNTAHERGYGKHWRKARAAALARDDYLCQDCLVKGRATPATQVDHVIPKAKGGGDELDNLRSLCRTHHDEKTARDNGWRVKREIGPDGWPVE